MALAKATESAAISIAKRLDPRLYGKMSWPSDLGGSKATCELDAVLASASAMVKDDAEDEAAGNPPANPVFNGVKTFLGAGRSGSKRCCLGGMHCVAELLVGNVIVAKTAPVKTNRPRHDAACRQDRDMVDNADEKLPETIHKDANVAEGQDESDVTSGDCGDTKDDCLEGQGGNDVTIDDCKDTEVDCMERQNENDRLVNHCATAPG